jgi:hypothetical protein
MAKTAPTTHLVIPTATLYELEKIIDGNTTTKKALQALVQNQNFNARFLVPTLVNQYMMFRWAGYGNRYLHETAAVAAPGTIRLVYRCPTVMGHTATPTLRYNIAAESPTNLTNGYCRVETSTANATSTIAGPGAPLTKNLTDASGALAFGITGLETITVRLYKDPGSAFFRLYSFNLWQESGANPCPAGMDVEPYLADEPLAVYLYRYLLAQQEYLLKNRRGMVVNWSDDIAIVAAGGRVFYTVTNDTVRPIVRLPIRWGPLTTSLRVEANGHADPAGHLKFYVTTGNQTPEGAFDDLTLNPVAWGAFNAQTTWQNGTVNVPETKGIGTGFLWLDTYSPNATATVMSGLSVWENPVP